MSLLPIVRALGGDLYDGGRRANVPGPGHSRRDRSVSLMLSGGRVIAHGFGAVDWREALDDLRRRDLIDASGRPRSILGTAAEPTYTEPLTAAQRRSAARRLWAEGAPITSDTPASRHAERRGVTRVLPGSDVLRFHPRAPLSVYRPNRLTKPALLAAVCDVEGELTALEVTYLDPSGRQASSLRLSRKTVGVLPPGCAVRLDLAAPEMLVGEGVFTTLSATERFGLPGWALLSTTNLRQWRPPPGVRQVLIAADRDRQGLRAARELAVNLRRTSSFVLIRPPQRPYGDWSDWRTANGARS